MRIYVLACVVLGALLIASSASAARYSPSRTAACLVAAGKRVQTKNPEVEYTLPEIRDQIYWKLGKATDVGFGVAIMFTSSDSDASRLTTRLARVASAEGAADDEIPRMLGHQANAVWFYEASARGLTRAQTALIKRCLQ
jgi:hypothetical protein